MLIALGVAIYLLLGLAWVMFHVKFLLEDFAPKPTLVDYVWAILLWWVMILAYLVSEGNGKLAPKLEEWTEQVNAWSERHKKH